jgi:hypothetical protein
MMVSPADNSSSNILSVRQPIAELFVDLMHPNQPCILIPGSGTSIEFLYPSKYSMTDGHLEADPHLDA